MNALELRLIPDLNVTEYLFLGRELVRRGQRDNRAMAARARVLLDEYGVRVSETALLRDLSHPDKQMIEVIANLDRNASYLFLDEPTTAINGKQAEDLLARMEQIAVAKRIGVILVSHKLDEVLGVSDEATVLMAGRTVLTCEVSSHCSANSRSGRPEAASSAESRSLKVALPQAWAAK